MKMENLRGINIDTLPLKDLTKVSDLVYFDGPLLSHYLSPGRDNYLYHWVDVDDNFNRWLIFRVSSDRLQAFVNKRISLYKIITEPDDHFVYKVDIDPNFENQNVMIVYPENIPDTYLPTKQLVYELDGKQGFDLAGFSEQYHSGVLQAYYNNSSKVGYNEINLELFGASLYSFGNLTKGLGKAFLAKKISEAPKNLKGKVVINKDVISNATKLNYFANVGGSFSALFKSYSSQLGLDGIATPEDEFIKYVIDFMNTTENYDKLLENVSKIDPKVIASYKSLLGTIIASKLQFFLRYENAVSRVSDMKELSYPQAIKIMANLEKLEYDNKDDIKLTGQFKGVSLTNGTYEFHSADDDAEVSKGKFDSARLEMAGLIKFSSYYDVVINRQQLKQTGSKEPKIKDVLTSFIEVERAP